MNAKNLFVIDANIIVSAFLAKEGKARQALDKARYGGNILMSEAIWQEIKDVYSTNRKAIA